jgi:hypothetical protein
VQLTNKQGSAMFNDFYKLYPKKVARKDAEKAWNKLTYEQQTQALTAITNHVAYWNATNTEKAFIPHPSTWLNGFRFEDEIEMPEAKKPKEDKSWMFSNEGIERKAKELGVLGSGYDTYDSLKKKIMAKLVQREME